MAGRGSNPKLTSLAGALMLVVIAGACSRAAGDDTGMSAELTGATSTTAAATAETTAAPTTTEVPTTTTAAAPMTTAAPIRVRAVVEQEWTPFAFVAGITLTHPSRRVERVAFHQSNHEGARQLGVLPTAAAPATLESRERETDTRTSADVVSDPDLEIRAPVSGVVKRAGTYVLYCRHSDDFVVIAPDGNPAWEVKLLHIDGVLVRPGDRVVAGETVLAPRPTQLPFESQVDELRTADPAWPHVHLEVVDPSIPNRPSPGGGC